MLSYLDSLLSAPLLWVNSSGVGVGRREGERTEFYFPDWGRRQTLWLVTAVLGFMGKGGGPHIPHKGAHIEQLSQLLVIYYELNCTTLPKFIC